MREYKYVVPMTRAAQIESIAFYVVVLYFFDVFLVHSCVVFLVPVGVIFVRHVAVLVAVYVDDAVF